MLHGPINTNAPKVGVHDGRFHADELIAITLLYLIYPKLTVTRTRAMNILDSCDIVADVGGVYDSKTNRYDHHMATFNYYFNDTFSISIMSSASLIWKHFGDDILREHYKITDQELINEMKSVIYKCIFESVDMSDNGCLPCKCYSKLQTDLLCSYNQFIHTLCNYGQYNQMFPVAIEETQKWILPILDYMVVNYLMLKKYYESREACPIVIKNFGKVLDFTNIPDDLRFDYYLGFNRDTDILGAIVKVDHLFPSKLSSPAYTFTPITLIKFNTMPEDLKNDDKIFNSRDEAIAYLTDLFNKA